MPEIDKIISWDGFTVGGLLINIISSAVFPILIAASVGFFSFAKKIGKANFLQSYHMRMVFFSALVLVASIALYHYGAVHPVILMALVITTVCAFSYITFKPLADIGILSASRKVESGIGYSNALGMCESRLYLLGTSGAKLTDKEEFVEAIRRCNSNSSEPTVRFLLSKPNNPLLIDAARQAGENPSAYTEKSKASLSNLARLKKDYALNFEVRFYKSASQRDFPQFRLMFINESICLVSYNVYGKGDGSRQPQIVLKKDENAKEVSNFYFAFKAYYDRIWDEADRWDFREYID